jgi:hypothetical protein
MINCCGLGDLIPRRVPWSPELQARMSLLAERVGDNWRAISLLSATMALSACTITTQAPIPPTATSPTVTPPLDEMRPLTPTEKAALAKTLTQTLKDANAAQFKWLPVAASGSGPIGYCGLVNVKNSSGGYVGFRRFFAMISKGPKGDYIKGHIEHIESIPVTSRGNSTEDDAVETGLTEDNCKEWGYVDFNGAI